MFVLSIFHEIPETDASEYMYVLVFSREKLTDRYEILTYAKHLKMNRNPTLISV